MGTIALLSFISITLSTSIADNNLGKANAINQAGSLRMMSYRLLNDTQAGKSEEVIRDELSEFQLRLDSLDQFIVSRSADYSELPGKFAKVNNRWSEQIKPNLEKVIAGQRYPAIEHLQRTIPLFVSQIDSVVLMIEEDLERRIALLKSIQIVLLIIAVGVCIVTMWMMQNQVVRPLAELLNAAKQVREKNFQTRVHHVDQDELGQLGQGFNTMVEELAHLYATQEQTILEKTQELTNTNKSLELLYKTTLRLSDNELSVATLTELLKDVEKELNLGAGSICISENQVLPAHMVTTNLSLDQIEHLCSDKNCDNCFKTSNDESLPNNSEVAFIPIHQIDHLKGVMPFMIKDGEPLPAWKRRALETIGRNLSIALTKMQRQEERHRIAVLEERSVIARELHDSIAQSLSYLRIQVARLEKNNLSHEAHQEIVGELKTGLASAYKELRELISAFRLRIDERGFQIALVETLEEFSKRCNASINCKNELSAMLLSANEEIHVLRIIREALANIEKHANASTVFIHAFMNDDKAIEISVKDNGVGIGDSKSPENHYGLIIMEDRAKSLGGTIKIRNGAGGGTEVSLIFTPEKPVDSDNMTKA